MQNNQDCERLALEKSMVEKIIEMEWLFAKKARIYSRLLTDMALAEMMEELATEREQTAQGWTALLTGKSDETGGSDGASNNEQGESEA